jgi:hypothetical protein
LNALPCCSENHAPRLLVARCGARCRRSGGRGAWATLAGRGRSNALVLLATSRACATGRWRRRTSCRRGRRVTHGGARRRSGANAVVGTDARRAGSGGSNALHGRLWRNAIHGGTRRRSRSNALITLATTPRGSARRSHRPNGVVTLATTPRGSARRSHRPNAIIAIGLASGTARGRCSRTDAGVGVTRERSEHDSGKKDGDAEGVLHRSRLDVARRPVMQRRLSPFWMTTLKST